ncbi:MAG TPA: aminopeptidase [Symbiobacteriaceae bacterium]
MTLTEIAKGLLQSSLNLQPGEKLLVVTDPARRTIGDALFVAGQELGADAVLAVMSPREVSGQEPPDHVTAAMLAADVIVAPTTHSLTHTQARLRASERGARVATMPGITEDMFRQGAITADYSVVEQLTERVTAILNDAAEVRLVTGNGRHVLRMSIAGRKAISSTGVYRKPGQFGNLPSGESYLAPVEGTAEGEMLVNGSIAGIGRLDAPVLLKIAGGRLIAAEGPEGDRFLAMLDKSPMGRNVAELGIGTNDKARLTGNILEDEKIYGTVHVAFGSNDTFGGTVKAGVHLDAVVLDADLYVDGRLLVSKGQIRV